MNSKKKSTRGNADKTLKGGVSHEFELRLYVNGLSPRSQVAIETIRRIYEANFRNKYKLSIIDINKSPELAIKDQIIATPTLIRISPDSVKRIIGLCNDSRKLLLLLNIKKD